MTRVPQTSAAFELVLVTYRSAQHVRALLAGLPDDLPVVVVDNSADVDGVQALVSARPAGRYLDGGGRGFAHAANLGAATSNLDYLVFGNPDSRPTIEVYRQLVDHVAADDACASASATLVDAHGRPQIGVGGWEPTSRRAWVHAVGLHKVWPRAGLFATPALGEPLTVDWTTGAALAVRRSTFLALGGFDEAFYVYNEDMAYGRAARAAGLHQVLRTDLVVPHAEGGSGAPSLEMLRLRGASMARYLRRYSRPGTAFGVRVALAAGYGARAAQQVLASRNVPRAREHAAYVRGVVTAKAFVGGREI